VDGRLLSVGAKGWKYQKKNKKRHKNNKKEQKLFFVHPVVQADGLLESPYPTNPIKKLKPSIQLIGNWAEQARTSNPVI